MLHEALDTNARKEECTCTEKYLCRQAAGQQWPNDKFLRPLRNIQGTSPRDRRCHRRGQRAAVSFPQTFFRALSFLFCFVEDQKNICVGRLRSMPSHAFLMAHMNFGAHPSKTREATVKISFSGSSPCTWNCIFTHAEAHNGVSRARNTNLPAQAFNGGKSAVNRHRSRKCRDRHILCVAEMV